MFTKISAVKEGQVVQIRGWIYRQRSSNKFAFIILRDSSDIIQCVFDKSQLSETIFARADSISIESSVVISGSVRKDKRAPTGFELDATDISIINKAERFPITRDISEDFLLDVRHLWVRSRKLVNMMKIKHVFFQAAREYMVKEGFYETQSPSITSSAGEGGSTLFKFKYFGSPAYLSQTGQLYSESLIYALEKVFCFAPSFRAEKSRTRRHLAEFWHLEPEAAWYTHEDNIKLQMGLLRYVCSEISKKCPKELEFFERDPRDLEDLRFERITYHEAIKRLQKGGFDVDDNSDFGTKEEFFLTGKSKKCLIVEKFPLAVKAFYMKTDPQEPYLALCNDILAPEGFGEIVGASERETNNDLLIQRLKKEGADLKHYDWYLDLRKFGSVPHSGFGMGVERIIRWICKLDHIRDAIPFPRTLSRAYP